MIGINAKIVMERTLYVDLPDDTKDEDVLETANKEIILPANALALIATTLDRLHVNIPHLDLKDWNTTDVKFDIIK